MESVDPRILDFGSYENYLDSFVTVQDVKYLPSIKIARFIAELGYRTTSEVLSREQFNQKCQEAYELLYPSRKPHKLFSDGASPEDPFLKELAARERANRVGVLSTIIHLRHRTKKGTEISGYIDYAYSLRLTQANTVDCIDWPAIFHGKKRLWPTPKDLGYHNWRNCTTHTNDTENYKTLCDPAEGLTFLNRHDRRIIHPGPDAKSAGTNTTRTEIQSFKYDHCVLFDHVVRRMF